MMINNYLGIRTPAESQAEALSSDYTLKNHGIVNIRKAYWNLPTESLYEEAVFRGEAKISRMGALVVDSRPHTARAAQDKFVVREPSTEDDIWWGEYNRPISPEKFETIYERMLGYIQGRDLFIQDCYAGADHDYRLPIRIITELAWHSHFSRNMFILPENREEYRQHVPEFTVLAVPSFNAYEPIDGTRTPTFIILNFEKQIALIGGTGYGGEIKKSIFTVMNYLLPLKGVMTMHCSANTSDKGDTALFFGLSGTGKTTLSADPNRNLIGDDEHGWSDKGVFNFEGGCYAKVIQLSPTAEPEIYQTTRTFGTVLENVVIDPITRKIDLDDEEITENTRASYPLEYIGNAVPEKMGGHPHNIILLTCDAQGVLPPIARLSPAQTMYHFISGYTSKVGGTEVGLGEEPEITFSACFGAPFMVHPPIYYAEMLARKMERYGVTCWLLNTGWVGGSYGIGKRISIRHTRNMLSAAINGDLSKIEYYQDPVFGFEVPTSCPEVPADVLYPFKAWPSKKEYDKKYRQLAARFIDNFKKFAPDCPPEVVDAGPKL
jgi:phosphoenolpyruvate carboxykinase (ATP)